MGVVQVVVGGESGPRARPFHLEWARSIQEQCRQASVAYFAKQLGSNAHYLDRPYPTRNAHGSDIEEFPEEMRIRQYPRRGP
jgi:protein gp37